ncbi:hypothetical protein DFH11DRAFT_1582778 [Phellopilus nigrolimitatus]|nr:hypothetical protein DFH11DRAFT_1582778 [Phellopilus nigrolimitatus]
MAQETSSSSKSAELLALLRSKKSLHSDEEELSTELTAFLTSAVCDAQPLYTLSDIHHALANSGAATDLDALHAVPLLLAVADPAAGEILSILGECGNAKETVISVQEALERLLRDLTSEEEDLENDPENVIRRLERALLLYIGAIPRLKLRKKSASETLKPLFADIPPVIERSSSYFSKEYGQIAMRLVCRLLSNTVPWASNDPDFVNVQDLCRGILVSSLGDLSPFLDIHLAQQKFESSFPRLVFRSKTSVADEGSSIVQDCADVADELSFSLDTLIHDHSTGAVVLSAFIHSRTPPSRSLPSPNTILSALMPILIASLQSSTGTDASLYVLLSVLFPPSPSSASTTSTELDPDLIPPFVDALAPLACTSPDPQIRLVAFKILGTLLARAQPLAQMALLTELLAESAFPALRVAGVGLLKDAVLNALSASSSSSTNPFASPALLRTFGYVVLRTDPPSLFSKPADLKNLQAFLETQEPKRLVECLAFYYVLLMRDRNNLTGVRDSDQIKSVEKDFLIPLRNSLQAWSELEDLETVDEHAMMALAALGTSLERIDEAKTML